MAKPWLQIYACQGQQLTTDTVTGRALIAGYCDSLVQIFLLQEERQPRAD